jgi:hypothetical protein
MYTRIYIHIISRSSVVGIATRYVLDGPWIETRGGRGEREFSASVLTNHGAHPAPCTVGNGSLSRDKAAGAWR